MASNISKRERLMNLVATLLFHQEPVPFRDIAGKVIGYDDAVGEEALQKRFDRDKADLRCLGLPIEYVATDEAGRVGYRIRPERVFQQRVDLTPEDAVLLAIAARVGATATGGGPLDDALKSALRKLATDAPGIGEGFADVESLTVLRARPGDPRTVDNLVTLAEALSHRVPVAFAYSGLHDAVPREREVEPFGLGLARGHWYLVGHCRQREDTRVFRLARMSGRVRPLGSPLRSRPPVDFRVEDYVGRSAWDLGNEDPVDLLMDVAREVPLLAQFADARVVSETPRFVRAVVTVRRPRALIPWVLSHGGAVKVLEPIELRQQIRAAAQSILDRGEVRPGSQSASGSAQEESPW